MRVHLPLAAALLAATTAAAQLPVAKYELGFNVGTYIYQGDLTPSLPGSFRRPGWVVGISGGRRITPYLSARLDLNRGAMRGDDAAYKLPEWRRQRAFAFRTPVTEVIGSVVYHPLQTKWNPYLFAGAGAALFNIRRSYSNLNAAYFSETDPVHALPQDLARTLPRLLPIVPLGIGATYPLSQNFLLQAEGSYRFMASDYLDGFSLSANPSRPDFYYKFSIGIVYRLGRKANYGCPVVKP